jgi:hypothetical protein
MLPITMGCDILHPSSYLILMIGFGNTLLDNWMSLMSTLGDLCQILEKSGNPRDVVKIDGDLVFIDVKNNG